MSQWARANMLHFAHHWPSQANVRFWPQAIEYSLWVFNQMPNMHTNLSPNIIWSSCPTSTEEFNRSHVFVCQVYVLDAKLQEGHTYKMVAGSKAWSLSSFLYTSLLPGPSSDECIDWKDFTPISCNLWPQIWDGSMEGQTWIHRSSIQMYLQARVRVLQGYQLRQ